MEQDVGEQLKRILQTIQSCCNMDTEVKFDDAIDKKITELREKNDKFISEFEMFKRQNKDLM